MSLCRSVSLSCTHHNYAFPFVLSPLSSLLSLSLPLPRASLLRATYVTRNSQCQTWVPSKKKTDRSRVCLQQQVAGEATSFFPLLICAYCSTSSIISHANQVCWFTGSLAPHSREKLLCCCCGSDRAVQRVSRARNVTCSLLCCSYCCTSVYLSFVLLCCAVHVNQCWRVRSMFDPRSERGWGRVKVKVTERNKASRSVPVSYGSSSKASATLPQSGRASVHRKSGEEIGSSPYHPFRRFTAE